MTIETRWLTLLLPATLLACSSSDSPADAGAAGGSGTAGTSAMAGSGGTSTAGAGGTSAGAGGTSAGMGGTGGTSAGMGGTGGTNTAGSGGSAGSGGAGGGTIPDAIKVPDASAIVLLKAHGVGAQIYTCTDTTTGAGGAGGSGTGGSGGGAGTGGSAGAATGGTGGAGGSGGVPANPIQWVLKAPQADLFDAANQKIGTHYAGPTWESTDGSKVVGTKIASAASPTSGNIPWLLLQAKSTSGMGVFTKVTYVQRLDTQGGVAPADGCDAGHLGAESPVSYEANYVFYGAP